MALPRRPVLRPSVTPVVIDGDLILRSYSRLLRLRGATARQVLPGLLALLDGSRTVDDLEQALEPGAGVREVLALLEDAGVLADADLLGRHQLVTARARVLAFFEALGLDGLAALDALGQAELSVVSVQPDLADVLLDVFGQYELGNVEVLVLSDDSGDTSMEDIRGHHQPVVEQLEGGVFDNRLRSKDLIVAVVDRWSPTFMRAINRAALRCSSPLLPLCPTSEAECLLGPTVVPGETACWRCMEVRQRSNWLSRESWEMAIERHLEGHPLTGFLSGMPAAHAEIVLRMLAVEATKWLAKCNYFMQTLDHVLALRPFTLEVEQHVVLKVPRCPDCSRLQHHPATRVWMQRE